MTVTLNGQKIKPIVLDLEDSDPNAITREHKRMSVPTQHDLDQIGALVGRNFEALGHCNCRAAAYSLIAATVIVTLGLVLASVLTGGLLAAALGIGAVSFFLISGGTTLYFIHRAFCSEEQQKVDEASRVVFDHQSIRQIFEHSSDDVIGWDGLSHRYPNNNAKLTAYFQLKDLEKRFEHIQSRARELYEEIYTNYTEHQETIKTWKNKVQQVFQSGAETPDSIAKPETLNTAADAKAEELAKWKNKNLKEIDTAAMQAFRIIAQEFQAIFHNNTQDLPAEKLLEESIGWVRQVLERNGANESWTNIKDSMSERFLLLPKLLLPHLLLRTSVINTIQILHIFESLEMRLDASGQRNLPSNKKSVILIALQQNITRDLSHLQSGLYSLSNQELNAFLKSLIPPDPTNTQPEEVPDNIKNLLLNFSKIIGETTYPLQHVNHLFEDIEEVLPILFNT